MARRTYISDIRISAGNTKCGTLDLLNRSGSNFANRLIVLLILGLGAEEVKGKEAFYEFCRIQADLEESRSALFVV